jgi:glycine/D-amino acid oxidase-like deaminating enzyme
VPFPRNPRPDILKTLNDAVHVPFWLDDVKRPPPSAPLAEITDSDLVVIGAGFTGLWMALLAKELDRACDVVLLEAEETASGASGRNGGFAAASLTHGFENGLNHWPGELAMLTQMGQQNLQAIQETVLRLGIECDFIRSGELLVATEEFQLDELRHLPELAAPFGEEFVWLNQEQTKAMVNSPLYLGGLYNPHGVVMLNPAQLAWGLRKACIELGVRCYDHTPALHLEEEGNLIIVHTPNGKVKTQKVGLATNAYPPLLKQLNHYIVPVYDYVLVTEPLAKEQRNAIGWQGRQGVSDTNNQFHYYRTTIDGRILWGGYDAVYYPYNGVGTQYDINYEVFGRLAEHFFMTFPMLEGLRFTHAYGGAIDTCSRFSPFWGTAHHGKTAYVAGFTGLGVGSSRFGAQVMLDILEGEKNQRTQLEMVRRKPIPFPPEPLRSLVINLTRRSLDQADHQQGKRNWWLKILDAFKLGFDS